MQSYFEALYEYNPTGQVILWTTKGVDSKNETFIIDGQQRLTSLVCIFTGKPPKFYEGEGFEFTLYFNPFEEECHIIEIQYGDLVIEDDIERLSYYNNKII